uniref:Uncharacterized protein n=1 Tax=Anguilla anguilla TaxID=7936 RepID=A0A0E9SPI2_ANGAN
MVSHKSSMKCVAKAVYRKDKI